MNMELYVVLLVAAILIFAVLKRRADHRGKSPKANSQPKEELNEKFLDNPTGSPVIPLVRIYSPTDKMVIRSILDSQQILSYVELEHLSSLWPGVMLEGFSDTIIYIYSDDRTAAEKLVKEYIQSILDNDESAQSAEMFASFNDLPPRESRVLPELMV